MTMTRETARQAFVEALEGCKDIGCGREPTSDGVARSWTWKSIADTLLYDDPSSLRKVRRMEAFPSVDRFEKLTELLRPKTVTQRKYQQSTFDWLIETYNKAAELDRQHKRTEPATTHSDQDKELRQRRNDDGSIAGACLARSSKPSIAVLPFANLSIDNTQDYFVEGITNDIITDLSKFKTLFIIAANSTFQYKGKSEPVQDIARDLGVRYVLEGSVQRTDDHLRINAQLIDGPSGVHIWAERFDRSVADIFEVQNDIIRTIVGTIGTVQGGPLLQAELDRLSRQPTTSLGAYDHYLRGLRHKLLETREDNRAARELFERAIELDRDFAQAHAELSETYLRDVSGDWTNTRDADLAKGMQLALRVIEIDPTEPLGYGALGFAHNLQAQNDQAITMLRKAERLNPNAHDIKSFLGYLLAYSGSPEEGLSYHEAAHKLDPFRDEQQLRGLAQTQFFARRYEEAIATLNSISRRHRSSYWLYLAASYAQLNRLDEARSAIDEMLKLESNLTLDGEIERRLKNGLSSQNASHLRGALRKAGGLPEN